MTTHTTHTHPRPARSPRPTVAQRRQADLAEGIIKLSPSSLTFLYEECPACFWHHYNGRPRPATAFPKVFGALDNAQKEFFVGRSVKEVKKSLPAGVIQRGKRVKSEAIALPGTSYRVQFGGETDTILKFSRAGYGVCDFKTSSPGDEAAALYGRQLHAYAIALEQPSGEALRLAPVSRLGLICFPPEGMVQLPGKKREYAYRTSAVWVEVERNDEAFLNFVADAVKLITRRTMPRSAPNCGWCRWTRMTAPLLEQQSAPLVERATFATDAA
ncbi:MAG: PD-(D/E)XK nuclease family protein [Myxococcales bacterium]|nr:PD-(D/E)XK nuclease family protein [Myxococcales bacterium]